MSRTIRHRRTFAWYKEEIYSCKICGRSHGYMYCKPNVPECADGQYCETSQNRALKEHRNETARKIGKNIVIKFKAGHDIENMPYLCNTDIRMDYHLI